MDNSTKPFGRLFRDLRIDAGYTLRRYCKKFKQDPLVISRFERGINPGGRLTEEELLNMLPAIICTADGKKPTEEQINGLIEIIRGEK